MVESARLWGQWRVYYLLPEGVTRYVPASWTDVGPQDAFVTLAQGRAIARFDDVLELAKITRETVKENTPYV
jgi:hypothetical protein